MTSSRLRSILSLALVSACHRGAVANPTSPTTPKAAPSKPVTAGEATPRTPEQLQAAAFDATVLITTEWGAGTGVFIDPRGYLLTNYHVVASGRNEDFGIGVGVTLPQRHDDGSITAGERLTAVAVAIDEKRDLALLKVGGDGREFPSLSIAATDPRPGTRVFALGNAGVGLGWAIKRCAINAIGTLDDQVSAIVQMQRDVSAEEKTRIEEGIRKAATDAGRQIQTDCSILPGDSGGPLVDESTGELVGLNVAVRTAFSQFVSLGSLAFHIHAQELRDFAKDRPEAAKTFLPDPWTSAGTLGQLIDFDQDGEVDALTFAGTCGENLTCQVAFGDLDQNSFRRVKTLPTPAEVQGSRAFDAELAMLRNSRLPRKPQAFAMPVADTLAYLDTNDDGAFDTVVVQDGESGKTRGYTLVAGVPTREPALDGVLLRDLAQRFEKAPLRPGVERFVEALTTGQSELTGLDRVHAITARADDRSKDGVPDTLDVQTRLDKRVLFDVDQQVLPKLAAVAARSKARTRGTPRPGGDLALLRALRGGTLHADVMVVQSSPTRVFYDTNDDGAYDLMLEGASIDSGVALRAASIDAGGKLAIATEHLGRLLLRPALLHDKGRGERFATMLANSFPTAPRATLADDASSFPPPLPTAAVGVSPIGSFGNRVLSVFDRDAVVVLIDLDDDTFKGKRAKQSPLSVVQAGKFDAEVTLRFANGAVWAYYDADDDGRFEHIFVAGSGEPGKVAIGYKSGKRGVERDAARAGMRLIDPTLFRDNARRKLLEEIAKQLLPG